MTGRTLIDLEKPTMPVRILNLTDQEKRINKGTFIAIREPVQSVVLLKDYPSRQPSANLLLPHLRDK